jgi:SNF family Na+-dependent transporter
MEVLGQLIYTYYFYLFLVCSLILLVAMIGCIVLTLHHKAHVKRQEIFKQVSRNVQTAISLKQ